MRRRKYLSAHGPAMEGLHPFVWVWSLVAHDQKKKKGVWVFVGEGRHPFSSHIYRQLQLWLNFDCGFILTSPGYRPGLQ